ncbi:hypothetical protein KM043_002007 [Ampulex compressa]|nr:hypothetical protein KM043_002007 [Ampulex compressa]
MFHGKKSHYVGVSAQSVGKANNSVQFAKLAQGRNRRSRMAQLRGRHTPVRSPIRGATLTEDIRRHMRTCTEAIWREEREAKRNGKRVRGWLSRVRPGTACGDASIGAHPTNVNAPH